MRTPWMLRWRSQTTLFLAWAAGGSILGAGVVRINGILLDRHLPILVGALGGLFIGTLEAGLIVKNVKRSFPKTYPELWPNRSEEWDRMLPTHYALAQKRSRAALTATIITVVGMALLVAAILVPSLGLAAVAAGCAAVAGALLGWIGGAWEG